MGCVIPVFLWMPSNELQGLGMKEMMLVDLRKANLVWWSPEPITNVNYSTWEGAWKN